MLYWSRRNATCPEDVLDAKLVALTELMLEMFNSRDRAVDVSGHALNMRLEAMNEFRMQLREQASNFVTRDEHQLVLDQISRVEKSSDSHSSAVMLRLASLEAKFYIGGTGIVVVISLLQLVLNYAHG